jgi:hypothetical protein
MRLRSLIVPTVLVVLAANLLVAVTTRDGVGALEYVVSAALIALLLTTAFVRGRRAIRA